MWSWSISASGTKQSVIASISMQKPEDQLDDNDKVQFGKAQSDAVAQVTALVDGLHVAVGISGNAETFSSTIISAPMKKGE